MTKVYLEDFCRICGVVTMNKVHLFSLENSLLDKIIKLLPYEISLLDKLPKYSCYKCIDKLKDMVGFIEKSCYIQKTFWRKVLLEESKNAKEKEIPEKNNEEEVRKSIESIASNASAEIVLTDASTETVLSETSPNSITSSSKKDNKYIKECYKKRKFRSNNPFLTTKCKKKNSKKNKKEIEDENQENDIGKWKYIIDGDITIINKPKFKVMEHMIITKIPGFGDFFSCNICNCGFTNEQTALKHICFTPRKYPDSSGDYVCDICKSSFPRRAKLEYHLKSHLENYKTDQYSSEDTEEEENKKPKSKRQKSGKGRLPRPPGRPRKCSVSEHSSSSISLSEFINDEVENDDEEFIDDDEICRKRKIKRRTRRDSFVVSDSDHISFEDE